MLDNLIAAYGNRFLVAALGVSLALLCLFIVLWILRNRAPSPFVRGGRNRQPRLQVLDAAAIDTRRRIVLIRRDNVEHLVMIGGPTDIVIESGIGDERAYLSARPVAQVEDEPSALPSPAAQTNLAPAEPPSSMIAAPAVAAAPQPAEPPVRRPPVMEPARTEPAPQAIRPTPVSAAAAEPKPAPTPPVRPPEPMVEKPVAATVLPSVAASAAVAPATMAPISKTVEPTPEPVTEAATVGSDFRPYSPAEKPVQAEVEAAKPTAQLEPVLSVEADTRQTPANFQPIRPEPEKLQTAPAIEPRLTSGTPPIETFRMEPVEPVMTQEVQPANRDVDQFIARSEPASVPSPVIDTPAAEDLLEAARQRVLAPAPARVPAPAPVVSQQPQQVEMPPHAAPSMGPGEAPQRDMSDFERVLEEEMALHLAADPAPTTRPVPTLSPILPETRADRPRPPASAILPEGNRPVPGQNAAQPGEEPNLQNEIARIFGEMSASRNP